MKSRFLFYLFLILLTFYSCDRKKDLLSDDKSTIIKACNHFADTKDTSAVKLILGKSLDPRMSTDMRFKGFSVNYFRVRALKEISGLDLGRKIDQFGPDTVATLFYLEWAIKKGLVKDIADADIYYYK